jgi:putative endonuclease
VEFVYILHSKKDGKLYIGLTNNISRRIEEHNSGRVSATKGRRPLVLVHLENYLDRKQAVEREKFFKSGQGRELLKDLLNI